MGLVVFASEFTYQQSAEKNKQVALITAYSIL